jgi:hypothetical protein
MTERPWWRLDKRTEEIVAEARRAGRREPLQAYAADALVDLAREASVPASPSGPRAMVHVVVDHAALTRGRVARGERCEIPGIGPIPVASARSLTSDAVMKAIVTDGTDVKTVAHVGRTIPARMRTALEARDPTCVVPGCGSRRHLEIDHYRVAFADDGPTSLDNLARLCRWHHYLRTHCGYGLDGGPGRWVWVIPDRMDGPPDDARPPPN